MFGLQLVGEPRPIARDVLEALGALPRDYVGLMTSWGPGRARGLAELLDPRDPDGAFAEAQQRFRLHASHQRAMGRWTDLEDHELASGVVIARLRDGGAWVTARHGIAALDPDGKSRTFYTFEDTLRYGLFQSQRAKTPVIYCSDTPEERAAQRADFFEALRDGDEAAADICLARIFERGAAWPMFELAWELATGATALGGELRATYLDRALRLAKRVDPDALYELPLRQLRDALAAGSLGGDHRSVLERVVQPQGPFHGPTSEIERGLVAELLANPRDRSACIVLADHLDTHGLTLRAALVREQAEALPWDEVRERGLVMTTGDGAKILAGWIAAWRADDPTTSIDELVEQTRSQTGQLLTGVIGWTSYPEYTDRLGKEPIAFALTMLGLRSDRLRSHLGLVQRLQWAAAGPWLLAAIRNPTRRDKDDGRDELAATHHEVCKLAASEVDEVVTWTRGELRLRRAASCLLQRHGKDERVFEAALRHFADAHPYTERTIARRKTDPRVLPALLAHLDRAEELSLVDGKHVAYTTEYGILSRYLAKLGNARGRAAYERWKTKGRIDRAAADRETRREGM